MTPTNWAIFVRMVCFIRMSVLRMTTVCKAGWPTDRGGGPTWLRRAPSPARQVAPGRSTCWAALRDLTRGARPAYGSDQDSAPPSLPPREGVITNNHPGVRNDQGRAFELAQRGGFRTE